MRSIRVVCLIAVGILASKVAVGAELHHVGRLIDSTDAPVSPNFAVTGNHNVLYSGGGQTGENPLYRLRSAGGSVITVIGSDFASNVMGPVSMNNAGHVTFLSVSQSDPQFTGSFLVTPSTAGVQRDSLSGIKTGKRESAPSINDSGVVTFLSMDTGALQLSVRSAGGIRGTLPSLPVSRFSRPVINNAGDVAISGDFADGTSGIIVHRAVGSVPITIRGANLRISSSQPQIVDNQKAVLATFSDEGLPTGRRKMGIALYDPIGGDYSPPSVIAELNTDATGYMNEALSVCVVDGESLKLFTQNLTSGREGSTHSLFTLASIGDTIGGSAITSMTLGDGSMMSDNSVVFHASLANGTTGLYQIVVPEPATVALLAASGLACRRRRA